MRYDEDESDWKDYQKLVLHELGRLNTNFETINEKQQEFAISLETLKVKHGFLAVIAGFLSALGYNVGKSFLIDK